MKSKRTKALEITPETKIKVWARQNGKSVFPPYLPISISECCCHYIPRSRGGLGIPENIFGCVQQPWYNEHYLFDGQLKPENGAMSRETMKEIVKDHLSSNYPEWDEKKLVYTKCGKRT